MMGVITCDLVRICANSTKQAFDPPPKTVNCVEKIFAKQTHIQAFFCDHLAITFYMTFLMYIN